MFLTRIWNLDQLSAPLNFFRGAPQGGEGYKKRGCMFFFMARDPKDTIDLVDSKDSGAPARPVKPRAPSIAQSAMHLFIIQKSLRQSSVPYGGVPHLQVALFLKGTSTLLWQLLPWSHVR